MPLEEKKRSTVLRASIPSWAAWTGTVPWPRRRPTASDDAAARGTNLTKGFESAEVVASIGAFSKHDDDPRARRSVCPVVLLFATTFSNRVDELLEREAQRPQRRLLGRPALLSCLAVLAAQAANAPSAGRGLIAPSPEEQSRPKRGLSRRAGLREQPADALWICEVLV